MSDFFAITLFYVLILAVIVIAVLYLERHQW